MGAGAGVSLGEGVESADVGCVEIQGVGCGHSGCPFDAGLPTKRNSAGKPSKLSETTYTARGTKMLAGRAANCRFSFFVEPGR
jgi:hypothetical protein